MTVVFCDSQPGMGKLLRRTYHLIVCMDLMCVLLATTTTHVCFGDCDYSVMTLR
eukprot:SAG31_NODE_4341_length_3339_cov_1.487346_5_plen_54_part_00